MRINTFVLQALRDEGTVLLTQLASSPFSPPATDELCVALLDDLRCSPAPLAAAMRTSITDPCLDTAGLSSKEPNLPAPDEQQRPQPPPQLGQQQQHEQKQVQVSNDSTSLLLHYAQAELQQTPQPLKLGSFPDHRGLLSQEQATPDKVGLQTHAVSGDANVVWHRSIRKHPSDTVFEDNTNQELLPVACSPAFVDCREDRARFQEEVETAAHQLQREGKIPRPNRCSILDSTQLNPVTRD